jgi:uncharacterized DUF497 family protein
MKKTRFEWDENKDAENQKKHGVQFSQAQYAFADPSRSSPKTSHTVKLKNAISVSARSRVVFSLSDSPIAAVLFV